MDANSRVPIYLQLVERIKHLIATGALAPGEQLPTVRSLASELRINFNTVARAYAILDEAGVISTQQGRGTFVRARPRAGELAALRSERLSLVVGGAVVEALSLGYTADEVREACEWALHRVRESQTHQEARDVRP